METLRLINGNHQEYRIDVPRLVILGKFNDAAVEHIRENTGLAFERNFYNLVAQPTSSKQIVKLLLTYNFKTQYHNNNTNQNTLFLKSDHHVGFQVDSICYECCKENHIPLHGLTADSRLSC